MAESRGRIGLRWAVTAVVVVLLGALVGLSISLMRSPSPLVPAPVVKSLPPTPPPEVPSFLGAEEEDVEAVHQAQNEALASLEVEEDQETEWPPPPGLTMPEVVEGEPSVEEDDQVETLTPPTPPATAEEASPEGPASITLATEPPETQPQAAPDEEVTSEGEELQFAYTIHLESFRNPLIAERRKQQIEALGLEGFTVRVDLPEKGIFNRVCVGRFQDKAQAKALQGRLKKDYDLPEGRVMADSEIDR